MYEDWYTPERLKRVSIYRASEAVYPRTPPYHPHEVYPEYPFPSALSEEPNYAYEAVRGALYLLGLDRERYGTPQWNPLAEVIRPGDLVVIKPNMVRDFHERRSMGTEALITHGSVIRAVLDYVYLAMGGSGRVIVCDSPQNDALWEGLWNAFAFDHLLAFYRDSAPDFQVDIYDARIEAVIKKNGVVVKRYARPRDPYGYSLINLGEHSEFYEVPERSSRLYGAEYDISQTNEHHTADRHEYYIANTFLQADVVINVPKLKTHKKSGITVWMKSVIGINGDKNWLPHHTEGTPAEGGDQFAQDTVKTRSEQRVVAVTKKVLRHAGPVGGYVGVFLRKLGSYVFGDTNKGTIRSGNWHGNDTIWRTVFDVLKCWIYADKNGVLQNTPQRRFLCIVDGIIGGEGNGPLDPDPVESAVCIAGFDAYAVDTTAAVLMGFDPERIRALKRAPLARGYPLVFVNREQIECRSNHPAWNGGIDDLHDTLDFEPHFGWKNYLEAPHRRKPDNTNGQER